MNLKHSVLIIGRVFPEPSSSAAGLRMMQIIQLFQEFGFKITFCSTSLESKFSENLETIGISVNKIELNCSSFDDYLKDLKPTIVLFDRFITEEQFGWRVMENCPNALKILDTEDLHFLRDARKKVAKNNEIFKRQDFYTDLSKREVASILRCDISLIISEYEMDLLTNEFKIDKNILCYLPILFDKITGEIVNEWNDFSSREHFFFIGNFLHEPNLDTVFYLKNEIWSEIKTQIPKAELHIFGAYPSSKILQLHNPLEGFIIQGRAENVKEIFSKYRILLAPLRFGAGIKGKLLEAMLYGVPSITTNIGSEGIIGNYEWNGYVEDNGQNLIEKSIELYQNKKKWTKMQMNGAKIINSRFLKKDFSNKFESKIDMIFSQLENHRIENFMGTLLLHHSNLSTKYLSKWIELKNKKR
jgi:O-antigen biosynthesis protein